MVQTARALALTGWVRNVDNGSVEAVVQGPSTVVETMVGLAHAGPPHARVSDVVATAAPFHPNDGFHQLGIRQQSKNPV